MDAIEMLEEQHRDVEDLFEELESADAADKQDLFDELADQLAVHTLIEEMHFYPAVRAKRTSDILDESLEEDKLFPKVRKVLEKKELVALAEDMSVTQENLLDAGQPRERLLPQTPEAASLR